MASVRRTAVVAALFVAWHLTSVASEQAQPLRAGVSVVRVDVSVLDKHRVPVDGLSAADFTVRDDGVPRPVVALLPVAVDTAMSGKDAIVGDAHPSLEAAFAGPDERGRLVVIMFDRTIPAGAGTNVARQVAAAFVSALAPGDYAAVTRTSGFAGEGSTQEITKDHAALMRAIESPFVGMTSPPVMAGGGLADGPRMQETGECVCGVCSLEAIAAVARAIQADTSRRKMLVFIGSDMPFTLETGGCDARVRDARQRLYRDLDRANLTVHVVDPMELESGGVPAGSFTHNGAAYTQLKTRDRLIRQGNLAVLPDRTGGRLVTNANNPEAFAASILRESRSYYLLGFEPAEGARGGKTREIDVRVNRPGVRVIARKSYVVPAR